MTIMANFVCLVIIITHEHALLNVMQSVSIDIVCYYKPHICLSIVIK